MLPPGRIASAILSPSVGLPEVLRVGQLCKKRHTLCKKRYTLCSIGNCCYRCRQLGWLLGSFKSLLLLRLGTL